MLHIKQKQPGAVRLGFGALDLRSEPSEFQAFFGHTLAFSTSSDYTLSWWHRDGVPDSRCMVLRAHKAMHPLLSLRNLALRRPNHSSETCCASLGAMKTTALLIVDADQQQLLELLQLIERLLPGAEILSAGTAEDGLALAAQAPPDGALIRLQMPGMDGIEMCKRLGASEVTSRVPVVLITNRRTSSKRKARGLAAGADGFISRPLDTTELSAKIKMMLRVKRAEDELRVMKNRLEEAMASRTQELSDSLRMSLDIVLAVPSGILIYEHEPPDRLILKAANPAVGQQIGVAVEEWYGKEFDEMWPAAGEAGLKEAFLNVLQTGECYRGENVYYKDARIDGFFMVRAFRMPRGRLGVVIENVTERKRARESVEASYRRYRDLVENAVDMICTLDLDGTITYASPALLQTLGYTSKEVVGENIKRIMVDEDSERTERAFKAGSDGPPVGTYEFLLKKKDDTHVPGEIVSNLIYTADGAIAGTQAILRDISERRSLEAQLLQAQKMEAVGRLAGGVAHDFNNLLTAIIGYSELVLNRLSESDPIRKEIEEIMKTGERAASLTRQLLAFSRKQVMKPIVLDLDGLVADLEKMLRRLIGEDVDLITILEPKLGRVRADPGQIEQVIMNLAVNARDAMPQGGKIVIETANVHLDKTDARDHAGLAPGPYVMLAVSDTGAGMDPETLSHIFEPFFTTKAHGKGTGLGLSTAYGITQQSGGHVTAQSEPGAGTTFKIYLPRLEETAAAVQPDQVWSGAMKGSETVLLVADEDVVRNLARAILEENGYNVLEARYGGEALLMCERHKEPIHLLLTDLVMPGVSGGKLGEYLTFLRKEMKVLYMSGYTGSSLIRETALVNGFAFMQKPFTPHSLTRKVREVLDEPRRGAPAPQ